jgi:hypothetical protein
LIGLVRPDAKIVVDAIFERLLSGLLKALCSQQNNDRVFKACFVLHCQMARLLGASVTWLFRLNIKAAYPLQKRLKTI